MRYVFRTHIAAPPIAVYRLLLEESTQVSRRSGHIETRGEWPEEGSSLRHAFPLGFGHSTRHLQAVAPPRFFRIVTGFSLFGLRLIRSTTTITLSDTETGTDIEWDRETEPAFVGLCLAALHRKEEQNLLRRVEARYARGGQNQPSQRKDA